MGNIKNTKIKNKKPKNEIVWFQAALIFLTILFYFNTANNSFSFKDDLVSIQNEDNPKTFLDLPEVFSTPYADQNGFLITYRPLTRASYAIEYQFTADSPNNAKISHILNLLLYLIGILLLFGLLRKLFQNYNIWFAFFVALLFMAHPLHSEVVYNLRNRDFILAFVFSVIALNQFLCWINGQKIRNFIFGSFAFSLALLSHETALIMLAVFTLTYYFFTNASIKGILSLTFVEALVAFITLGAPFLYLTQPETHFFYIDNPLFRDGGIVARFAAFFSTLGWSFKMLILPYPLQFYYGYNTVSLVDLSNVWLWITAIIHVFLLIIALKGFRSKSIFSFIILLYFATTIPFANLFVIIPGMVYERLLFTAALPVSIAIVWLLFAIFRNKSMFDPSHNTNITGIGLALLLVIGPYFALDFTRGKDWENEASIFNADAIKLENSAGYHNYIADKNLKPLIIEMAKPVSPYFFIRKAIKAVEDETWKTLDLDTAFAPGYERLAYIQAQIHGKQAMLRYESAMEKGDTVKIKEEEKTALTYLLQAQTYYLKALEFGSTDSANVYYMMAEAFALQYRNEEAARYLIKAIKMEPLNRKYNAKLIDAYLHAGLFNQAISQNEIYRNKFPDSDVPDRNLAGYYYFRGDTLLAIQHYEMAIDKGTKPEVGKFLHKYYSKKGDTEKANYFLQKAYEAERYYDPEKY